MRLADERRLTLSNSQGLRSFCTLCWWHTLTRVGLRRYTIKKQLFGAVRPGFKGWFEKVGLARVWGYSMSRWVTDHQVVNILCCGISLNSGHTCQIFKIQRVNDKCSIQQQLCFIPLSFAFWKLVNKYIYLDYYQENRPRLNDRNTTYCQCLLSLLELAFYK